MMHLVGPTRNNHVDAVGINNMDMPEHEIYNNEDVVLTHSEDDLNLANINTGAEAANVVLQEEQNAWLQGYPDISHYFEQIKHDDFEHDPSLSLDSSLTSMIIDAQKTHCPLYNYFNGASNTSDTFGSSETQLMDTPFVERHGDFITPAATLRSPAASLEKELLHMVESAWKSTAPKRETPYPKRGKHVYLKILATQLVSGTIIGRGGKGFNWFRRKSNIDDILLSMPWELYPKTDLRTMFLEGTTSAVVKAACIVADLMLSKYVAQQSATLTQTDKMLVLVVLPLFAKTAIESIRDRADKNVISITLFESGPEYKEFVAVIKGYKPKVKSLIAAIANSLAETLERKDYCHIAYMGPDAFNPKMLPSNRLSYKDNKKYVEPSRFGKLLTDDLMIDKDAYMSNTRPMNNQDADSHTEEASSYDMNEAVQALDETVGINHHENMPPDISRVVALSETNSRVSQYPVNLNIIIPVEKTAGVISITRASKCYFTTSPAEDDQMVVFSLSGSFQEVVSVGSSIVSVIN